MEERHHPNENLSSFIICSSKLNYSEVCVLKKRKFHYIGGIHKFKLRHVIKLVVIRANRKKISRWSSVSVLFYRGKSSY